MDDDDPKGKLFQPLLELEVAVHRDERVDVPIGATEQFTVLEARPSEPLDGHDLVLGQSLRQIVREILVKQYAHEQGPCRA